MPAGVPTSYPCSGSGGTLALTTMQTAVRPRRPVTTRPPDPPHGVTGLSFHAVLMFAVIAVAAGLVALALAPVFAGATRAFRFAQDRLVYTVDQDDVSFPRFPERSSIYASNGDLLATIYLDENRKYVKISNVAQVAVDAVLAIEDDRFYEHNGVDVKAIFRALMENLKAGRVTQGGSTLTQQLVKLQFTEGEDTLSRKLNEASMALAVEKVYTKDQILELYLNKVYLGNGVYGIGTASEYYFGKPARQLTLTEGALLAGLVARPEEFNPITHPEAADFRRDTVINTMAALEMISEADRAAAVDMPLGLKPNPGTPKAQRDPYFVQYIKSKILDVKGHPEFDVLGKTYKQRKEALFQGGLSIHTTLDPEWQEWAQDSVRGNLAESSDPEGAVATVETRTGAIRTLLSGSDFARDELNLAAGPGRQTGSAAKPFTLVAAFRRGFPPGKVYEASSPKEIPGWRSPCGCVYNAAEGGSGEYMDLWAATENSVNVVFAQLAVDVGAEHIVKAAHDMGITTPLDAVPAITLGSEEATPLDMATAYATLANEGVRCEPFAVQRIEVRRQTVYKHRAKPFCEHVVSPEIANLVTAMLERATCCGTGYRALLGTGHPQAGKTGTASDNTNAWYVGYIRQVSTAVWVGHVRGQIPMDDDYYGGPVYGGTFPADIWHDYMVNVVQRFPYQDFPAPPPPEYGTVPGVVGMMEGEAQETLAEANFTPRVEVTKGAEPAGTVIGQSPGGGARIELGGLVTISVSDGTGPPKQRVPNVIGLTRDVAWSKLHARGFRVDVDRVEVSDRSQDDRVVAQAPQGGAKVKEGATIVISVGKFKPGGGGGDGGGGGGGDGDGD
jgi:penicillin-binding protein 1A